MREFEHNPKNVYVLVRVYNLEESEPGIKLFRDPWGLFLNRTLSFKAEQGYRVYEGTSP
jgi:hypothetical protein